MSIITSPDNYAGRPKKSLRIAILGTRGVPAKYGGFETCTEELGKRLVEKGHRVSVYCRSSYYEQKSDEYLGMKLIYMPNLRHKSLDTMSHTLLSVFHALFSNYDVFMVFNAANSPFVLPLRIFGKKIIINTDGLEWKRSKWGFAGKSYYKIAEIIACFIANRLVSDSKGIKEYYYQTHHTDSTEIAYGAYVQECKKPKKLADLGIETNEYFLQVTRFEPENNPLLTIDAFKRLKSKKKLVIVGGNPYPNDYTKKINSEATSSIILPGFIYDKELLQELWCSCLAYIHGNEVGGTNPALLQAMASGCFTMAINVPFNRDVLAEAGVYYDRNEESLGDKMKWVLDNETLLNDYKIRAQARITANYSWEKVTNQYENLFYDVTYGMYP
jgi:glycosyltransferase involved in cell wall biosynthesis